MGLFTAQIERNKREKRDLVEKLRRTLERAEKEDRAMTTEERSEFDKINKAVDDHEVRLKDLEKMDKADDDEPEGDEPGEITGAEADDTGSRSRGRIGLEGRGDRRSSADYRKKLANYRHWIKKGEVRDSTLGTATAGGNLVLPVEISRDIIEQTKNLCFVRSLARIYKNDRAQAIGVRQKTARMSAAAWTTEIGTATADSAMTFGQRQLLPNQLVKLALVSNLLLEQSEDIESEVNEELAYQFAVTQENGFLNGSGSGQPLGVFTASANGVPTSQDYTSTATADFKADDLIGMKYALKQTYFGDPKCRWVMSRPITQEVRTFKDNYGQYLWRAGLASDKPDTVLDVQLAISEYAPSVKTTGSYIAVLGNFGYYAIGETKAMRMQRLVELYAGTNEVGFKAYWFLDGAPVLGEAFSRLKTS